MQRDIFARWRRCGPKPGGRLDEIGAAPSCASVAGDCFLLVVEQRGFENHLDDRAPAMSRLRPRRSNIGRSPRRHFAQRSAPTLITMSISCAPSRIAAVGFGDLRSPVAFAPSGKPDHRAHFHRRSGQFRGDQRNPARIHADAGESVLPRLAHRLCGCPRRWRPASAECDRSGLRWRESATQARNYRAAIEGFDVLDSR